MPITRRSAAAKGKMLQSCVAHALAHVTGLTLEDFQGARGGKKERDISLSKEARKRWPIHVECKNQRRLNLPAFVRQMEADAAAEGLGFAPSLVFKVHGRSMPYIMFSFVDFLELRFGPLRPSTRKALVRIFRGEKPPAPKGRRYKTCDTKTTSARRKPLHRSMWTTPRSAASSPR